MVIIQCVNVFIEAEKYCVNPFCLVSTNTAKTIVIYLGGEKNFFYSDIFIWEMIRARPNSKAVTNHIVFIEMDKIALNWEATFNFF